MNYFDKYSSEQAELITLPYSRGRSTRYSDRLRDFSVTIPRGYKDVYVNSFFPGTATPWNFLPLECFPLIYDLNGFQSRINCRFFLNRFPVCFKLFMLLFLVTPYLVVAAQRCMEWIPFKKKSVRHTYRSNCTSEKILRRFHTHFVTLVSFLHTHLLLRCFSKNICFYARNEQL